MRKVICKTTFCQTCGSRVQLITGPLEDKAYVRKLEKVARAACDYCLCESGEEWEPLKRMQKALKALGE